jgi:hypothetical protein
VNEGLPADTRRRVLQHVLRRVHPDRREAEVVGVRPAVDGGRLLGVKAHPRGYLSSASYALVTVDEDGAVIGAEACTGRELRRVLDG